MGKTAVIIGGTGQIGQAVAAVLLRAGWDVALTHRGHRTGPAHLVELGARTVVHDREQAGLSGVIGGGADVVIDTIAYDASHAEQLLEVQDDVGALVVISSSSVYCDAQGRSLDEARANGFPDLPEAMAETQPTLPPGDDNYSTRKVALERRLLDDAATPVTILRPCAIHGAHSVHPREWWFVKRMLDGRGIIPLAYDGASRFQTTSVANIAGLIGVVVERPASRILNIGDQHCLNVAEIGRVIGQRLGFSGQFVAGDTGYPPQVGATPWSVPAPFMIDSTAARKLGFEPLSYADSVGPACDWLVELARSGDWVERLPIFSQYPEDPFDYAAEDRFLYATG